MHDNTNETFAQIGTRIGALVMVKNAAYGSSFATSAEALKLLYPNGIAHEQMADALLIVRIWDKLQRIATDRDALGESPYGDITGYGILGVAMHQNEKEETWPGNASDPSATSSPKAKADSAEQPIRPKTTATPAESIALLNSPSSDVSPANSLASASTNSRESAPAPIATGSANAKEAVLSAARARNEGGFCAGCGIYLQRHDRRITNPGPNRFWVCDEMCKAYVEARIA